jgi:hypothetical protein
MSPLTEPQFLYTPDLDGVDPPIGGILGTALTTDGNARFIGPLMSFDNCLRIAGSNFSMRSTALSRERASISKPLTGETTGDS